MYDYFNEWCSLDLYVVTIKYIAEIHTEPNVLAIFMCPGTLLNILCVSGISRVCKSRPPFPFQVSWPKTLKAWLEQRAEQEIHSPGLTVTGTAVFSSLHTWTVTSTLRSPGCQALQTWNFPAPTSILARITVLR